MANSYPDPDPNTSVEFLSLARKHLQSASDKLRDVLKDLEKARELAKGAAGVIPGEKVVSDSGKGIAEFGEAKVVEGIATNAYELLAKSGAVQSVIERQDAPKKK